MTKDLQVFNNEEFGELRTIEIDGEAWFVGKDVATILGYKDTNQAIRKHTDEEDRLTRCFDGSGQNREMAIINESGLYSLILSSKLPSAKKFKHWVTSEVLPSIRKTGKYDVREQQMDDDILLAKALILANERIIQKDEAIKMLTESNQEMQPKADYYDELVDRQLNLSIRETAKELGVGEKRLISILLDKNYLYRDNKNRLQPYAEYIDKYFVMKECFSNQTRWCGTQILTTVKGRKKFLKII